MMKMGTYKQKCLEEIKIMLEITAENCCNNCNNCCEENGCVLTKIRDGLTNLYGTDLEE